MLSEMTSRQVSEWMAFFALEPWGWNASLYGHAVTSSTIANVNKKKGKRSFKPFDFMPVEKQRERSTQQTFFQGLKDMLFSNSKKKAKRNKK